MSPSRLLYKECRLGKALFSAFHFCGWGENVASPDTPNNKLQIRNAQLKKSKVLDPKLYRSEPLNAKPLDSEPHLRHRVDLLEKALPWGQACPNDSEIEF